MEKVMFRLRDINPAMTQAWRAEFQGQRDVEITTGDIFEFVADAIVSPANSFGFMDGGIDLRYSQHFGWGLQHRLQALLHAEHDGELPVGQAVIVPTERDDIPFVISAPTMRIPTYVANTANAYLAFRAAIRAVRDHNRRGERPIQSVLCPGLGTAIGEMPVERCANQMRLAFEISYLGRVPRYLTLGDAAEGHVWCVNK